MIIGMLLNAPYPSDIRVKKEAGALLKAGFKIYLLCLQEANEPIHEEVEGMHVTRIAAGSNDYSHAFWDVVMSATFQHPLFKRAIPGWVKRNNIQVLHVHDLPLAGTALALRSRLGIPVVSDFHENYPDALRVWFQWKKNPIAVLKNKLFLNPTIWAKHERRATRESDHVIAVVDEMKRRLVRDYHVSEDHVTVITNSEERSFLAQPEDPDIYAAYRDKFIITYSGNIGPHRGVDTAVEAMRYLKDYPDIVLVIVGSGNKVGMKNLQDMTAAWGLTDRVFFLGRQPFTRFYSFMKFADANIIPHKSNSHTDHTVPHKLFQAMMVGKPVIVSSSAPLKRIILQTEAGVVFAAGDAADLARQMIRLYTDRQLQKTLGANGLRATTSDGLNWETDQNQLIGLYKRILKVDVN